MRSLTSSLACIALAAAAGCHDPNDSMQADMRVAHGDDGGVDMRGDLGPLYDVCSDGWIRTRAYAPGSVPNLGLRLILAADASGVIHLFSQRASGVVDLTDDGVSTTIGGLGGYPFAAANNGVVALHVATTDGATVWDASRGAGGTWQTSPFAVAPFNVGAMTIDPAGATHVIMVAKDGAISHATNASGRWVTERAGTTKLPDDMLQVAADGGGAVHVFLFHAGVYLTNNSGAWQSEDVSSLYHDWGTFAVALDGTAHIFTNFGDNAKTAAGWQETVFPSVLDETYLWGLAAGRDATGMLRLGYGLGSSLSTGVLSGGVWTSTPVPIHLPPINLYIGGVPNQMIFFTDGQTRPLFLVATTDPPDAPTTAVELRACP